jgi:hypothetical protein
MLCGPRRPCSPSRCHASADDAGARARQATIATRRTCLTRTTLTRRRGRRVLDRSADRSARNASTRVAVDMSIFAFLGGWLVGRRRGGPLGQRRESGRATTLHGSIRPSATFGRAGRRPCSQPGESAQLNEAAKPSNIASLTTRVRRHSEPSQRPLYRSGVLCVSDDSRSANRKARSGTLSSNII